MQPTQAKDLRTRSSARRQLTLVLCLFAAYTAFTAWHVHKSGSIFWDAHIYARAIHAYVSGGDPYARVVGGNNFVYSPMFLRVAVLLSHLFPFHSASFVYVTLTFFSLAAIPIIFSAFYLRSASLTPALAVAVFAFHPGLMAEVSFTTGNLSTLIYAIVVGAAIPGLRDNKWLLFYLAIVVCSVTKPTMLTWLLLPVLLGQRQMLPSILSAVAVFAEAAIERFTFPVPYQAFLESVKYQVVVRQDAGFGIFSYLLHRSGRIPILHQEFAYLVHILLSACLIVGLWWIRPTRMHTVSKASWTAAVAVTAIVLNPRIQVYDADIAIVPAVFLAAEAVRILIRRRVSPILYLLPSALFASFLVDHTSLAMCLFLMGSVLMFVILARIENAPAAEPLSPEAF